MKKITLVLLSISSVLSFGQKNYMDDYRTWSLGVDIGHSYFFGDLRSLHPDRSRFSNGIGSYARGQFSLGGAVHLTKYMNPFYGIYGTITAARTTGTFPSTTGFHSGFHFIGTVIVPEIGANINFINAFRIGEVRPTKHALMGSVGLANTIYDYDLFYNNTTNSPAVYTQGFNWRSAIAVPVALRYKYRINLSWDFDAAVKGFFFNSDVIDGLNYGSTNDQMIFTTIGTTYNFGRKAGKKESIVYRSPMSDIYAFAASVRQDMDKLTKDDDGDGVSNFFDKEPNTPKGAVVDGAGRALDIDGDGIPDHMDEDPFTPKGVKVDSKGRELDSDGDGVPDSRDLEPNTPKGSLVDVRGRAIKGVGGGINDAFIPQVYFAVNSATITAANAERLAVVARLMNGNPDMKLKVVGHTDKTGGEEYNRRLGQRRADAAVDYLVRNFGIDRSRFTTESAGKSQPLSPRLLNINRRVEFLIAQ
ncbi:OmpA family protein [Schleiferia thermophila]|uniref:OmpA family protein n=1 Tax=Schleiferia thermophila TaxID=884107 RepID=UPI003EE8EE7C